MHVDQSGQQVPSAEVDHGVAARRVAVGADAGDALPVDDQVARHEAFAVENRGIAVQSSHRSVKK